VERWKGGRLNSAHGERVGNRNREMVWSGLEKHPQSTIPLTPVLNKTATAGGKHGGGHFQLTMSPGFLEETEAGGSSAVEETR
jgi:hypothetical protein